MGGTAEVWRAWDEREHRPVAAKILHAHLLPDDESRSRLTDEARAVAGLAHPGIIRVLDIDPGPAPAVILELVEGEPLSARLQREGPLSTREAASIAAALADALYHAHTRGVVHRDVKPGNVLLGNDGRPRLIDFGIARILGEAAERRTETGMVMGTLRYMAPEQLAGEPVTPRADLYGLGAVLFEMLTGAPPYPAPSPAELIEQQAAGPPALAGTDPVVARLTRACLARNPADRPRHAGLVAAALRAWLAGDPAPAAALASPAPLRSRRRRRLRILDPSPTERIPAAPPRRAGPAGRAPLWRPVLAAAARIPRVLREPRGSRLRPVATATIILLLFAGGVAMAAQFAAPSPAASTAGDAAGPTPSAIGLPAWAATLAASYRDACSADVTVDGTTASQLAAMGQDAAQRYVDALTTGCQSGSAEQATTSGSTSGSGNVSEANQVPPGHQPGHGHGHGKGHGRG